MLCRDTLKRVIRQVTDREKIFAKDIRKRAVIQIYKQLLKLEHKYLNLKINKRFY